LVLLELRDPAVTEVAGALRLPEDFSGDAAAVVDRLEDVGATRTSLDRFDRVEREPLPEDVLDLPFERLAAKSGALFAGTTPAAP
jgi:hypothetical protein